MQFAITGKTGGDLNFDFDEGHRKDRVLDDIGIIKHNRESKERNPGFGLYAANQRIFNPKYGDRSEIPNVLVLITREVSDKDMEEVKSEAKKLKDSGTTIICIGVSNAVCRAFTLWQ